MYHPSRGGVRGGRDQFNWDDVKVDKHRENYLGHSIKAPVGRWQKGKDLHWYSKDKKSKDADMEAAKAEIQRIKEEEEQAMREALGLAPKRSSRPQGNRLDKHELSELMKRGSTVEDLGAGIAEATRVQGLGYARAPTGSWKESSLSSLPPTVKEVSPERMDAVLPKALARNTEEELSDDDNSRKKRKREERKYDRHQEKKHNRHEKHDKREKYEKREKRHSRDSDDKKKYRRDERRHDS